MTYVRKRTTKMGDNMGCLVLSLTDRLDGCLNEVASIPIDNHSFKIADNRWQILPAIPTPNTYIHSKFILYHTGQLFRLYPGQL